MNQKHKSLLYRSLDAKLSPQEQEELARALESSPELQEMQKRLLAMRALLKNEASRTFRPFFSARVLQRIKSQTEKDQSLVGGLSWAFRRIAFVGGVAIALLVGVHFFVENHRSLDSVLGMPQLSLEHTWQLEDPVMEENP